ncbi:hypothetical protein HDU96_003597 [Phlyctochytrium bullatum]|nr:hypothetical protein HDU96_003597 [Phlyctochytrium bullatum]
MGRVVTDEDQALLTYLRRRDDTGEDHGDPRHLDRPGLLYPPGDRPSTRLSYREAATAQSDIVSVRGSKATASVVGGFVDASGGGVGDDGGRRLRFSVRQYDSTTFRPFSFRAVTKQEGPVTDGEREVPRAAVAAAGKPARLGLRSGEGSVGALVERQWLTTEQTCQIVQTHRRAATPKTIVTFNDQVANEGPDGDAGSGDRIVVAGGGGVDPSSQDYRVRPSKRSPRLVVSNPSGVSGQQLGSPVSPSRQPSNIDTSGDRKSTTGPPPKPKPHPDAYLGPMAPTPRVTSPTRPRSRRDPTHHLLDPSFASPPPPPVRDTAWWPTAPSPTPACRCHVDAVAACLGRLTRRTGRTALGLSNRIEFFLRWRYGGFDEDGAGPDIAARRWMAQQQLRPSAREDEDAKDVVSPLGLNGMGSAADGARILAPCSTFGRVDGRVMATRKSRLEESVGDAEDMPTLARLRQKHKGVVPKDTCQCAKQTAVTREAYPDMSSILFGVKPGPRTPKVAQKARTKAAPDPAPPVRFFRQSAWVPPSNDITYGEPGTSFYIDEKTRLQRDVCSNEREVQKERERARLKLIAVTNSKYYACSGDRETCKLPCH